MKRFGPLTILGKNAVGEKQLARPNSVLTGRYPDRDSEEYQWYRNGEPIFGAKSKSYTLEELDKGAVVNVRYSFKLSGQRHTVTSTDHATVPSQQLDYWEALYLKHKGEVPPKDDPGLLWWKETAEKLFVQGL